MKFHLVWVNTNEELEQRFIKNTEFTVLSSGLEWWRPGQDGSFFIPKERITFFALVIDD